MPTDNDLNESGEVALAEANRLLEQGRVHRHASQLDEAKACFDEALDLFRAHGDRVGEGKYWETWALSRGFKVRMCSKWTTITRRVKSREL